MTLFETPHIVITDEPSQEEPNEEDHPNLQFDDDNSMTSVLELSERITEIQSVDFQFDIQTPVSTPRILLPKTPIFQMNAPVQTKFTLATPEITVKAGTKGTVFQMMNTIEQMKTHVFVVTQNVIEKAYLCHNE